MKKIVFLSIFLPSLLFSQWVQQSVPSGINMVLSIDFYNVNTGVGSGWGGMFFGSAVYTTNSGANWLLAQVPDSSRSLVKVQMIDANTGYIAGAYNIFTGKTHAHVYGEGNMNFSNSARNYYEQIGMTGRRDEGYKGLFLKTTNGGRTWFTYGNLPSNVYYLMGMKFINVSTGFVTASLTFSAGYLNAVLKTTNGGLNWNTLYTIDTSDINSVFTLDGNMLFVTGWKRFGGNAPDGTILRSSNGGSSWNINVFPGIGFFYDVNFTNTSTGFAVTYDTLLNALIYRSTNAGLNWIKQPYVNSTGVYYSIEFVSGTGKGLITGNSVGGPNGFTHLLFCRTTDYGVNWTNYLIPDTIHMLHGSSLVDANNWFACGGGIYGPIIYKSTNGGAPIGIQPISSEIPNQFSVFQNYPNPFNPATIINYELPITNYVKLSVYDVLGKEIAVLVNEKQQAGIYKVAWNASTYPSGVYFYKLSVFDASAPLSITKKMVLVK